jgi:uncharacterized membrane protein
MGAVDMAVSEMLNNYLEEHPKQAKMIVDKVILAVVDDAWAVKPVLAVAPVISIPRPSDAATVRVSVPVAASAVAVTPDCAVLALILSRMA